MLGFDDEAECIVRSQELIVRPARKNSGGEFAEQILSELISDGLSGEALLKAFKAKQAQIRPAVEEMIQESQNVANGNGEYYTYDNIFHMED